jgi:predicted ArsR family transcriptional regulator
MRRSATYQQQCTPDRITAVLRTTTETCTADEIAFVLGVSRQDVQKVIGPMVVAKIVDRHHISDGTLRYCLNSLYLAGRPATQRREGGSINQAILHCLGEAAQPLTANEINELSGIDKVTIYSRLPHLINNGDVIRGGTRPNLNFRLATSEERQRARALMVSVDAHLDVVLDEIGRIAVHPNAEARGKAFLAINAAICRHVEAAEGLSQQSASSC